MEYYCISVEKINIEKNEIIVEGDDYRHLSKVLRKKEGDTLVITDGRLYIYECRIISKYAKKILCRIEDKKYNLYEPEINVTLLIAPLKNIWRFEYAIEKAVELGVKKIQPVLTEHTVVKNIFSKVKMERFGNIIKRATGQSQRCFMPELRNVISFSEMIEMTKKKKNRIVMYEFSNDEEVFSNEKSSDEYFLLIGPEGGFSKDEVNSLSEAGWTFKSLGERKLRAETAAIVSVYKILQV